MLYNISFGFSAECNNILCSSLVDENGAGHGRYPGGPIDLHIGIVIDCCEVVARVTQSRVRVVISCVVSQDNILLKKEQNLLKRCQQPKVAELSDCS